MQKKRTRTGRGQGTQTHKDKIIAKVKMMERYSRTGGEGEGGELEEVEELLVFTRQREKVKESGCKRQVEILLRKEQ